MKLQIPKNLTFIIACILVLLGLIGVLGKVSFLSTYAFWLALVGFILLVLGNLFDGL